MVRMSRTSGTFESTTGASVRSTAHSSGSEAFFAPEIRTVPSSGRPPTRRILSIGESLSPGARYSRRAVSTRGIACRSGTTAPGQRPACSRIARTASAWPAPTSTASQPPGRRTEAAAAASRRYTESASPGAKSATGRLVVADLGGERVATLLVDVRWVADDEVDAPGEAGHGLEQVALAGTRRGPRARAAARSRARPRARGERRRSRGRRRPRARRRGRARCSRSRCRRRRSADGRHRARARAPPRRGSRSPAAARARRA